MTRQVSFAMNNANDDDIAIGGLSPINDVGFVNGKKAVNAKLSRDCSPRELRHCLAGRKDACDIRISLFMIPFFGRIGIDIFKRSDRSR